MSTVHKAVLLKEVLEYLDPKPGENFIDCTFGGGGHARTILEHTSPDGKVLAIDQDSNALRRFKTQNSKFQIPNINERLILVNDNFENLKDIYAQRFSYPIFGILFDLGLSSDQLENSGKGFSFQKDEPLDMRFGTQTDVTAEVIVNKWPQEEVERILRIYGEEDKAREIAKTIIQTRKKQSIKTTFQLVDIVLKAKVPHSGIIPTKVGSYGASARRVYSVGVPTKSGRLYGASRKIHPATKTFQAIRIAVNRELEALKTALEQTVDILPSGGRLAVISFHGLEDKIVKQFFKQTQARSQFKILTKRPVKTSTEEIHKNPRARSARLRAAERI